MDQWLPAAIRRGVLCVLLGLAVPPLAAQARTGTGHLIAVDGRRMWIECAGSGAPTVVLEAGHNESARTWDRIFPTIASFTRVCRYDRAGLGRSDPAGTKDLRTGRQVVADLEALLTAAGERNPVVLLGHSLGGAFVRLHADAHPRRVAAIVLLDAVHERESDAVSALLTPAQRDAAAGMRPMSPEGVDIEAVLRELRDIGTPPKIPVVVVARGRPLGDDEMPPMWSSEQRLRREKVRQEMQADLARLSPAGTLIVAKRSGHFVHHDEPRVVVDAVRGVVNKWRAGNGR